MSLKSGDDKIKLPKQDESVNEGDNSSKPLFSPSNRVGLINGPFGQSQLTNNPINRVLFPNLNKEGTTTSDSDESKAFPDREKSEEVE